MGRRPEGAGAGRAVPDRAGHAACRPRASPTRRSARPPRPGRSRRRSAPRSTGCRRRHVRQQHGGRPARGRRRRCWRARSWWPKGKVADGIAALREAVEKEDALKYAEPPDWIHPVRHALGATLLKAGKPAEAEAVYREDLRALAGQRLVAVRPGPQPGGPGQGRGRSPQAVRGGVEARGREAVIVLLLPAGREVMTDRWQSGEGVASPYSGSGGFVTRRTVPDSRGSRPSSRSR